MNFTNDFVANSGCSENVKNFLGFFSAIQVYVSVAQDGIFYFVDRFISGEKRYYSETLEEIQEKLTKHLSKNYNIT